MTNAEANGEYQARIVPALRRIQDQHGYLMREELLKFSRESGIPLYRIQAVASFFPHFALTAPPKVTVRVCRDTACHMAGSEAAIAELKKAFEGRAHVEGTSCLGRCDRTPAACVSVNHLAQPSHTPEVPAAAAEAEESAEERYYLSRPVAQLKQVVQQTLEGKPPAPDRDANHPRVSTEKWLIDPYKGREPEYAAVLKAVAARRESLNRAADALRAKFEWPRERCDRFILAAESRLSVDVAMDDEMLDALRAWQTDSDWAKGPELGGWSDPILSELDDAHADLRGMGGAGIPATQKWRDVRDAIRTARSRGNDDRGFIVVNGDESEPATFKDRELLLRTPHVIVEGVILAALLTEATQGFIYIRHEYHEQIEACRAAILAAEKLGVCGREAKALGRPLPVSVFVSPGGYICGEQSALIEAMSDRRAEPRNLPPKLETNGLDDRPTLVSNVETYSWAPYIVIHGGKKYAVLGVNGWKGRRFFSVCGDVNRPGVYEVPMGLTLRELICGEQYCRGVVAGKKLKAFAPSGPSGGFLPAKLTAAAGLPKNYAEKPEWKALAQRRGFDPAARELDILDLELELNLFRALSPTQALGAGLVVYADDRDMVKEAVNAVQFFRNESCGKCVPCRIGSQKLAAMGGNLLEGRIDAAQWKEELQPLVKDLGDVMVLASICALGRSVPIPLKTLIDFFPEDLARHLKQASVAPASAPVEMAAAK